MFASIKAFVKSHKTAVTVTTIVAAGAAAVAVVYLQKKHTGEVVSQLADVVTEAAQETAEAVVAE